MGDLPEISTGSAGTGDGCGEVPNPPYQFTPVAFQLESHIDFIEVYEDGTTFLGSSNINGKVWNGSVWCFKTPDLAPVKNDSFAGFGLEYCVTAGKFAGSRDKLLVGDEAGGLTLLDIKIAPGSMEMLVHNSTSFAHDNLISAIAISPDGEKVATSSHDYSLVVWDMKTMEAEHNLFFRPAHGREVTCVQCAPKDTLFLTSSLDGDALLWDCRQSFPASGICKDNKFGLTSCDWIRQSSSETEVVLGDSEGCLSVYDIRQLDVAIFRQQVLEGAVRSIASQKGQVAACGDCSTVNVVNNRLDTIYSEKCHPSFATYVSWDSSRPGRLFSTGKNLTLQSHSVPIFPE